MHIAKGLLMPASVPESSAGVSPRSFSHRFNARFWCLDSVLESGAGVGARSRAGSGAQDSLSENGYGEIGQSHLAEKGGPTRNTKNI